MLISCQQFTNVLSAKMSTLVLHGALVAQNRNPGLILSNYILAFHFALICNTASSKPLRLFDRLLLVFPGSVPVQATW